MDREQQIVAGQLIGLGLEQRILPSGDAIGLWRDNAGRRRAVGGDGDKGGLVVGGVHRVSCFPNLIRSQVT